MNFSGIHAVALPSNVSKSNWNLEMLVFVEGGKPEYPEKNPRSRDENQQQTQPKHDAEAANQTRATLAGDKRSYHCAIPVRLELSIYMCAIFLTMTSHTFEIKCEYGRKSCHPM